MSSADIKSYIDKRIKEEVNSAMSAMKRQAYSELRAELRAELLAELRSELRSDRSGDSAPSANANSDSLALTINQQNAIVRQVMREAAAPIAKEVITKIVPVVRKYVDEKTDSVREFVQYQNCDGDSLVTEYRRRVCSDATGVKMLTSEESRRTVFGEHTSMAFHDSDSWDGR